MLNGTMILELLHQKPGRYIQRDMSLDRMKEGDGVDGVHTEKKTAGNIPLSCSSYLLPSP